MAENNPVAALTPPNRRTRLASAVLYLLAWSACAALSFHLISRSTFFGEDSWLPMRRALDFLANQSGESVYQALFFSQHVKFQYPPSSLFMVDFLRYLGFGSNEPLNYLNLALLLATGGVFAFFIKDLFGNITCKGVRIPIEPVAYVLVLRFYPDSLAFQLGQIQVVLGFLFFLACWAVLRNHTGRAGFLIGLAATVKPQFLPMGLLYLWQRDWRFVAGLCLIAVAAFALAVGLYGWTSHADYPTVLGFLSKHGEYQHLNQSVNGFMARWFYEGPPLDRDPHGPMVQTAFPPFIAPVYYSTLATSLVLFVVPFLLRARQDDRISRLLGFCFASLLFTMASPIAWVHHYNILLPVYAVALRVLFRHWRGMKAVLVLTVLGVSFILTGLQWVAPFAPTLPAQNLVQSHVFFGALFLVGVLAAEIRKEPRSPRRTTPA